MRLYVSKGVLIQQVTIPKNLLKRAGEKCLMEKIPPAYAKLNKKSGFNHLSYQPIFNYILPAYF